MAKVYVGIGHGGKDSGAVADGFYEDELNLAIGKACYEVLRRHGVDAMLSRTSDTDEKLNDKIAECNRFDPDLCLDVHNNAGGGDGGEVFFHHGGGRSKILAENIAQQMAKAGQNLRKGDSQKYDGLKTRLNAEGTDYYGFIRDTKAPAVIVECAFIDNAVDRQIIDTAQEQTAMGEAIAKGILKTLGIAYQKEETKMTNDYKGHWAQSAIQIMIDRGIMIGNGKGVFRPDDPITRAEVAQALTNLLDALNQ